MHALQEFRYYASNSEEEKIPIPLDIYFADEEGDSYCVELAGRLGGYVIGQDSDFVVLNSDGYKGYIPLEEMTWIASDSNINESQNDMINGFTVVKSKQKAAQAGVLGTGIVPPLESEGLSLSFTIYTPQILAQHFSLPVSLLPLLGALVGNDFTSQVTFPTSYAIPYTPSATPSSSPPPSISRTFHGLLFERRLKPSERILHAGTTLSSLLKPSVGKKRSKTPQSVMELIKMTVSTLVASSHAHPSLVGTGQQELIVEQIVEGTLPYAIPPRPLDEEVGHFVCALHTAQTCPLVALLERSEDESPQRAEVASLYLRAYRMGTFSPSLMDVLSTGSFWPEDFLENPDAESVSRSISRSVREFSYAILESGIGLPDHQTVDDEDVEMSEEQKEDVEEDIEEDLNEVIDVIEEDSDYEENLTDVDRLRGALRDLQYDEEHTMDDEEETLQGAGSVTEQGESSVQSTTLRSINAPARAVKFVKKISDRPKVVTEYVRRGTRIVPEPIQVPDLKHLLSLTEIGNNDNTEVKDLNPNDQIPLQLLPETTRFSALLQFLSSDTELIRSLDSCILMPILALRLVVRRLHERSSEGNGSSKERQLERWTRKEACAFVALLNPLNHSKFVPNNEVSERAIQLTAQILTALECIEHVAQVLLLTDLVPVWTHRFSGSAFHALLVAVASTPESTLDLDATAWSAAEEGLSACFAEGRKTKKAKRKEQRSVPQPPPTVKRGTGGMYSLLADMQG